MNEKAIYETPVHFRTITEKFCALRGDNVVVMRTVKENCESFRCMSAAECPKCKSCKNNL